MPPVRPHDFLVLTHGASGNSNAALLVALAEAFAKAGMSVSALRSALSPAQAERAAVSRATPKVTSRDSGARSR